MTGAALDTDFVDTKFLVVSAGVDTETATAPPATNEEIAKLMAEHGWNKGLVLFGALASESSVKVATSCNLLLKQHGFPFKDFKHVDLTFDDKPLVTKEDGKAGMGVSSPLWKTLTSGKAYMPALAIDGHLICDGYAVVKHLWEKYPDASLSAAEKKDVEKLIDINCKYSEPMFCALKHWGWCAINGHKPNYKAYGYGNQTIEWERMIVSTVDAFFKEMEQHLAAKKKANGKLNGYFVGNKMTLADCGLINWVNSFYLVTSLNIKKRYPCCWENNEIVMRVLKPEGSKDFYGTFPIYATVVSVLMAPKRGTGPFCLVGKGFYIENPKYW